MGLHSENLSSSVRPNAQKHVVQAKSIAFTQMAIYISKGVQTKAG